MQNDKLKCKITCALLLLCSCAFALSHAGKGPGSSSFEFLNIEVGSRETGMGSGSAISHGPNAYWWNPAGLSHLERKHISLMYNQFLEGITAQRAGYSFPMKNQKAAAVNILILSITGIEGYSWHDVPTGEVPAKDYCISFTQSKRFTGYLATGLTLKAIVEQLEEDSAFTIGFDLGILLEPFSNFWLSGGLRNIGVSGKFIEKKEPLPNSIFSGIGMRINKSTLISADLLYIDSETKYGAGVEFNLWNLIFFRAGWNNFADVDETFRIGAGWKLKDISLDYAYAPYGKLGNTSRVDLNIKFGKLPLIESIYRQARKLYKSENYEQAWIEFNKVNSLSPGYKKVKTWLEKTKSKIEPQ